MELILKRDVDNLGFMDDLVTVKKGYGRNYLIPRGYAIMATPSAKKELEEKLKQRAFKERKVIEEAEALNEKMATLEIKIPAKTGEAEKLFGSINNADLASELEKEGISIDKKFITIAGGVIKRAGQYDATVRFHREVIGNLTFDVIPEA